MFSSTLLVQVICGEVFLLHVQLQDPCHDFLFRHVFGHIPVLLCFLEPQFAASVIIEMHVHLFGGAINLPPPAAQAEKKKIALYWPPKLPGGQLVPPLCCPICHREIVTPAVPPNLSHDNCPGGSLLCKPLLYPSIINPLEKLPPPPPGGGAELTSIYKLPPWRNFFRILVLY